MTWRNISGRGVRARWRGGSSSLSARQHWGSRCSPGKAEVSADLIEESMFVCDHRNLAVEMGAVGNVGLGADVIHAELGEVIAGVKPGRERAEQITIYGGVGLAWMDLVAAWRVYQSALETGQGREMDFLA